MRFAVSVMFRTLALASSVIFWQATAATASQYQCRKQDSSLRIAVEVKKAGHTLPCEVIAEDDRGEYSVLYSANFDREYCPSRLERTKVELQRDGWTCELTSNVNIVRDGEFPTAEDSRENARLPGDIIGDNTIETVAGDERIVTAGRQCTLGNDQRLIQIEVEDPSSGKPCELVYWDDGDQSKPGQLLWRAEHDETFCPRRLDWIVEKWEDGGWQCEANDVQSAAVDSAAPATGDNDLSAQPDQVVPDTVSIDEQADISLEAIIAADAERIGEWMEVDPAIEIAAHGDLNDDGKDDAVVFLTYQSGQAAYRQYLMSYLVTDDRYELASVKLLTRVRAPLEQAQVKEIDNGTIWLTLPGGDGLETAQTGFQLRDEELVEIDSDPASISN